MTYQAKLSDRAAKQMYGLPSEAFDAYVDTMVDVVLYPGDPLRTFPTDDPYMRRAQFGDAGLITYLIDDGTETVTIYDVTWAG